MTTTDYALDEEDMAIDEGIGYPRAFAKLCRDHFDFGIYSHGPPFTFTPFPLCQDENSIAKQLDQMFPIIDPQAKPTAKPKIFVSLLWKQLNHLGNAGFDPAVIRVDPYGNVLYFHADKASPLAWDIDHCFPCSRGGLTVPRNLRILQWQVCRRKHNKLELLVPWWDFQLGISVNQFLSIFASSNSDFRHRAFRFLFSEGENQEIHDSQTVESHSFPLHFRESKEREGLAPAAIVVCQREPCDSSLALRSMDYNRQMRLHSPAIAARKGKPGEFKENNNPLFATNPYRAIVMARDSLRQKEAQRVQAEIQKLGDEVQEISRKNEEEKLAIQDLELQLIKRRRRAEKCRRLAEAQSSYRTVLEKMIRDAMHQSVIYKEQVRLNQAATSALMARLEAQKAICDAAEKELHKKLKQRDELETQVRPEWEQGRKRSRIDHAPSEDGDNKTVLCLPGIKPRTPLHKELRVLLEEEEHRASEGELPANAESKYGNSEEELRKTATKNLKEESNGPKTAAKDAENEIPDDNKHQEVEIGEGKLHKFRFSINREPEIEEDEETRKERGKGNVERWLQMLLANSEENIEPENYNDNENSQTHDLITRLNEQFPQIPVKGSTLVHKKKQEHIDQPKDKGKQVEVIEMEENNSAMKKGSVSEAGSQGVGSSKRIEATTERKDQKKGLTRSESARILRRIPSSPLILGMKKGVECMRKKPMVTGDDDSDENHAAEKRSIKSSINTIKRVVKL